MRSLHAHRPKPDFLSAHCRPKNRHPRKHCAGLTVWELCFLIFVLAVLVALLFPSIGGGNPGGARRAQASTMTKVLVNSIENFHQDYGHLPPVGKPRNAGEKFVLVGAPESGTQQHNADLLNVLRAIATGSNAGHALNPKRVTYYEGKKADDTKNPRDGFADGEAFAAEIRGRLYDPWGSEYCIVMETDNDESLDLSSIYADLTGSGNLIPRRVAVFSLGKNEKLGGKGYEGRYKKEKSNEPPDDVVSW